MVITVVRRSSVTSPTMTSDDPSALATSLPPDRHPQLPPRQLRFFYGPMDCGKSTLALQIDHNRARQGRRGLRLTRHDRSGRPEITTRVGLAADAIELTDATSVLGLVRQAWSNGRRIDYVIVDEAGFLTAAHVEELADLVDDWDIDVDCFGLATDFRSRLLPGARRLFELADEATPVQVDVLCWCGRTGRLNARVVDGEIVREGDTVVVADTSATPAGHDHVIHYEVLCRPHYRSGQLGPAPRPVGQLSLDV